MLFNIDKTLEGMFQDNIYVRVLTSCWGGRYYVIKEYVSEQRMEVIMLDQEGLNTFLSELIGNGSLEREEAEKFLMCDVLSNNKDAIN